MQLSITLLFVAGILGAQIIEGRSEFNKRNWFTDTLSSAYHAVASAVSHVYDTVASGVSSVVHYVSEHCGVVIGTSGSGVACVAKKRELQTNENYVDFLEQACQEVKDPRMVPGGDITLELVASVFVEIDYRGDQDGVLNRTEFVHFLKAMEIFHYCMKRSKHMQVTPA